MFLFSMNRLDMRSRNKSNKWIYQVILFTRFSSFFNVYNKPLKLLSCLDAVFHMTFKIYVGQVNWFGKCWIRNLYSSCIKLTKNDFIAEPILTREITNIHVNKARTPHEVHRLTDGRWFLSQYCQSIIFLHPDPSVCDLFFWGAAFI